MATIDDVRPLALRLPRSTEAFVYGRVKFRVGKIVYLAFSRDETELGFAFPKDERDWLVGTEPEKFRLPDTADLRWNWAVVRLAAIDVIEARELVLDAWRFVAPERLAAEVDARRRPVVRAAQADDAPAMAAVYVAAARAAWAHMFPADGFAQMRAPVERLAGKLDDPDPRRCALVAELDGSAVGFALVRPSEDADADPGSVGELDAFYVHPSVWGKGVGRALLAGALGALGASGFGEATLWTAKRNTRPRGIYEAAGWRLDGATHEKTYLGVSFDELRYRIAIGRSDPAPPR